MTLSSGWDAALLTAFGGVVAATIGAAVQYLSSKGQLREQRRTKLADELREHVRKVITQAAWFHVAHWKGRPSPQGDGEAWDAESVSNTLKLTDSIHRIQLLLNPTEATHAALIKALDSVRSAAFSKQTKDPAQFENAIHELMESSRVVVNHVEN
jgi:hypothetical protein